MRKFRNKPTVLDGYRFPSKLEAKRYGELKLMEKAGDIVRLNVHPDYQLYVEDEYICTYIADFEYFDVKRGTIHIEDTKGVRTALFILKKKLMRAIHGLEVEEIRS